MKIPVLVPQLPESVNDATLMDWHCMAGQPVSKDQELISLETDKVILEIPAPENGILEALIRQKGDTVSSGDVLGIIDTTAASQQNQQQAADSRQNDATAPASPDTVLAQTAGRTTGAPPPGQPVSPAVRRLLMEHQLRPEDIALDRRITKQDVLDYLDSKNKTLTSNNATLPRQASGTHRIPMTRLRARIAERMLEAQHSTATLTTFNEVNLKKIFDLRAEQRSRFEKTHQVKLGLMSFFVKASVEALKKFPIINASLEGKDIVFHDVHDIGIAVSTERGLVVPVLRNADQLGFAEIEKAITEFSVRAKDGKLSFEELTGGTFTITNGGIYGSMLSTPILNPPQSAIMGMHAIKDRPVVEDGQIVIRPMIYLALSYDHRIIDGRDAVSFLFTIKELLEDPIRLLLEI